MTSQREFQEEEACCIAAPGEDERSRQAAGDR